MNFLKKIKSSIYDPEFYSGLADKTLGSSIKYFFGLIFVISLVSVLVMSVTFVPKVKAFLVSFGNEIVSNYPQDLEVRVDAGVASTNVAEPYFIKIPNSLREDVQNNDLANYDNLMVIDTKSDFNLDKFDGYKTMSLLTKNLFVYRDDKGKITIQELKGVTNIKINHTTVVYWVNKFKPFVNAVPYALPILGFIAMFVFYIFKLLYLIVPALIIYFISRLRKIDLTYKKSYQMALHAMTLPLLLYIVLPFVGVGSVPFLFTAILVIVFLVNQKKQVDSSPVL
jgi:hypothetical protein